MKETYDKIVKVLTTAEAPCRVQLDNKGKIDILCGFNYPENLCDKIERALRCSGIVHNAYSISADVHGTTAIESHSISGGPRRNYTSEDGNWG